MTLPFPYKQLTSQLDDHHSSIDRDRWWVRCCFHKEDTASMCINKGGRWPWHYYCFACGAKGSPEKFAELTKQNPELVNFPIQENEPKQEIKYDWENVLEEMLPYQSLNDSVGFAELANHFGLRFETQEKFQIGYGEYHSIKNWFIPMFDSKGNICGLQQHYWKDDKHIKKCVKYSKHGIFKPNIKFDRSKPLFICEGFSDTAVMIEMGFQAIGRYNALHKLDKDTLKQIKKFSKVYIVADNDDVGIEGASYIKSSIIGLGGHTEIIFPRSWNTDFTTPQYKDIREQYLQEGKEITKMWIESNI